jgi:hypothetical protein
VFRSFSFGRKTHNRKPTAENGFLRQQTCYRFLLLIAVCPLMSEEKSGKLKLAITLHADFRLSLGSAGY